MDVDFARTYMDEAIIDWMKEKGGSYYGGKNAYNLLENVKQKIATLEFVGLNSQFCKNLQSFNVIFCENKTEEEIRSFLNDNDAKIFHLKTSEILLSAIKVYQILSSVENYKKRDSFVFDYSSQLFQQLENIKMAFQSKTAINLLIIVCEKDKSEDFQKLLKEIINVFPSYKKMILITDENEALPNIKNALIEGFDDIKTDDLTPETKEYHLSKKVNFQGNLLSLNSLTENNHNLVDSKTLLNLVTNKVINVGKEIKNFDDDHFYFPRDFHRFISFDKNDLFNAKFTIDEFVIEEFGSLPILSEPPRLPRGFYLRFLNGDTNEKEYICDTTKENLHVLTIDVFRNWTWKKSYGSISSLIKYKKNVNIYNSSYSEEILLKKCFAEKSLIIADIAGMGKSTLLINLSLKLKNMHPETWIIKINLRDLNKTLEKNEFSSEQLLDHILKTEYQNQTFTKKLFEYRLATEKVVMVFDGYDEVNSEHIHNIDNLLKYLQKRNAMIWITTRKQYTEKLEELLGVFSYSFKSFEEKEQLEFFKTFWKKNFRNALTDEMNKRLDIYALEISKWITSQMDKEFSGTALLTKMCAEVFQKNDHERNWCGCFNYVEDEMINDIMLPQNAGIYKIYEKFTDEKVKISVNKFDSSATEASRRHELLALNSLLNENLLKSLLTKTELKNVKQLLEDNKNEEYGLIDYIKDDQAYFAHLTFAEYFAIKFIQNRFDNESKCDIAFQCVNFIMAKASNIFKCFVCYLLQKRTETEELEEFLDGRSLVGYVAQRNLNHLLKYVMGIPYTNVNNKTPLHYAAEAGHTNIVLYLMNHCFTALFDEKKPTLVYLLKYILKNDDDGKSALIYAEEKGHQNIVKIFKAVENIVNLKYPKHEILTTEENDIKGVILSDYSVFGYQKLLSKFFKYEELDVIKVFYENINDDEITTQIFQNNDSYEEETIFDKIFSKKNIKDNFQKLKYLAENDGINTDIYEEEYSSFPPTVKLILIGVNNGRKDLGKYLLNNEKSENFIYFFVYTCDGLHDDEDSLRMMIFNIYQQRFPHLLDNLFLNFFERDIGHQYIMKLFSERCSNGEIRLKFDIDINIKNENGETPLFLASKHSYELKTIKFLTENEATIDEINIEGETPLFKAVKNIKFGIVKHLIENGANVNISNPSGITPLMLTAQSVDNLGQIINMNIIKFLVKSGACVFTKDKNNQTPFDYSLHDHKFFTLNDDMNQIPKYLLEQGIIYNSENLVNTTNKELKSILSFIEELFTMVEKLEDISIDEETIPLKFVINSRREQNMGDTLVIETLLHVAVRTGNIKAVKWLVDKGAKVKAINSLQQTSVMIAEEFGQHEILEFLESKNECDSDTSEINNLYDSDESDNSEEYDSYMNDDFYDNDDEYDDDDEHDDEEIYDDYNDGYDI